MIVGSRGDVQPFLALGLELHRHGHRVRIATHGTFRQFVKDTGLEFYDIGGDPHDLMSYMVKNPGLMPGWASLTNGDIRKKQKMLGQILEGCWNACFQPDTDQVPFIADAVISNPPAFAHVHCAEALGIPLQLSFTMPWSPTVAFPHPLVNISQSNAEPGLTNFLTYGLAEMMTWQGLGRVINDFRTSKLGLQGLTVRSGPGVVDRLKIPWTYCFSPEIVPKPDDWQNHIDVVGFYFLNLASGYKPPPDLAAFLAAGPPPIYIGFGSVVVEDPDEMTRVIFQATQNTGVRALISVGWGGLGSTSNSNIIIPPHVFLLGNVPHDWLFQHVFAVCHHGGAGTTAIGLQLGKPTIVVPFFGDQPFWGAMIHKAGAGPAPIRKDKLDVERLSAAIEVCKTREAAMAAARLGEQIRAQNGVVNGVESFYNHLPVLNMRCDLLPDQLAVWWNARHCLKLSALAAEILCKEGLLNVHELELHRHKEYDTRVQPTDPITGGVVEALLTITTFSDAVTQIFTEPVKGIINTTTAIPRSIMNILDSFTDGLSNTPMLWGSPVRAPGRMTNFTSGMKEGGKALMWGLSDGFTGLVTEPIDGFKEKRWKGLVQGTFRSYINLVLRPAAGALSLVTYPIRGAIRGLTRQNISVERHLRELRIHQGRVAAAEYLGEPVFEGPGPSKQEYYTTPHFDPDEETVRGDDRSPSPQRLRRVRRPGEGQVEPPKKLKRAHDHGKQVERRPTQGPPLPPRPQPQREARREQKIYYEDSPRKAEIIQLFQVACQKKNLKKRKKVMQKRIQWVIMKGGAGTVTQVTAKESSYYGNEHIHVAPPPIGQPPKRSAEIWTEEDEVLFSRQIEQAKKASLAPETYPGGQSYPLVPSTSTSVPPEAYGTHQHEHDDFYAARVYENQLLHAASAWIDREDSPPHQAAHINEDPNPFRREDERWHR